MNEPETSVLLEQAAAGVPVRPAPVAQLLRAGRRARRRRNAGVTLAVAAGVVLVVGGASTVLDLAGTDDDTIAATADQRGEQAASPEQGATADGMPASPEQSGPLATGGAAECAEEYSPDAVRGRGFAFDGVVLQIGPSVSTRDDLPGPPENLVGVTFAVQEWFHGGSGATVTVDLPTPGQWTSVGGGFGFTIGSRLLVSGEARWGGAQLDAPIAWTCGFTRYYDEQTAASWR